MSDTGLRSQLFRRKPAAALMAEAESRSGGLKRALGALDLTLLGIGAIVGAGIFVLTGVAAARYAGPAIVLSFVVSGFACAMAALCYAEFAAMIPVAGSAYSYSYATMGELLIGLTKYFALYNTERPHQSLGNKTPQEVHKTSSGGGAMIVDKYRAKERLPVTLRSSGTEFEEVRVENEPAIPIAKTGAAPSSCEKSSAT